MLKNATNPVKLSRRTFTIGAISAGVLNHVFGEAADTLLNPAATFPQTGQTDKPVIYQIFTGQEVGVNPTKAEGFRGEDGRTTIFDYWGIPEYQAWINGKKFDGGNVTANQQKLRQFYQQLAQLVNTSDAIRTGDFYDLQASNSQSVGYDQKRLYSYLRYSGKQKLLIICNFGKEKQANATVHIPDEAWQTMNLNTSRMHSFRDIFRSGTKLMGKNSVSITLPPLGVLVLEIT